MLNGLLGAPSGEEYGTSLDRGVGFGSNADIATTNGSLSAPAATASMEG